MVRILSWLVRPGAAELHDGAAAPTESRRGGRWRLACIFRRRTPAGAPPAPLTMMEGGRDVSAMGEGGTREEEETRWSTDECTSPGRKSWPRNHFFHKTKLLNLLHGSLWTSYRNRIYIIQHIYIANLELVLNKNLLFLGHISTENDQ